MKSVLVNIAEAVIKKKKKKLVLRLNHITALHYETSRKSTMVGGKVHKSAVSIP